MEYNDYFFLGCADSPEKNQANFLRYLDYFIDEGIKELEGKLTKTFRLKALPKRNPDHILEGILAYSPKDLDKKRTQENYYICNALCLLGVLKRIFCRNLYEYLKNPGMPGVVLNNYQDILRYILMDSEELCSLYSNCILNDTQYISNIDERYIQWISVHQVLRQTLFGQMSYNSFADMEISPSIAVIRQLIELRIRWAFGALSYIKEDTGEVIPLNLTKLFDCIGRHGDKIKFPLKLENIERIYKWSNMYVHSGKCDFSWIPYHIEFVLREFTFGHKTKTGRDMKNGIFTTDEIIRQIHDELLNEQHGCILLSCEPQCNIEV